MELLKKISSVFKKEDIDVENKNISADSNISANRDIEVFGQDNLTKQRLYEKWSCKDTWILHDEGLPLLLGIDPESAVLPDDELTNKLDDLRSHAQECVIKKLLPVTNSENNAKEWKVKPADLYSWATISRISVPSELCVLMDFILQTVKPVDIYKKTDTSADNNDAIYQKHREIVLGAATSLLVNVPESCRNSKGRIKSHLITNQIIENEEQWFGSEKPLLAASAMNDLIDSYLKLGQPVIK
ncbi:MAG: hypothetical protein MI865_06950 [Proteobacteria bacterium]|nr:hypothetical protein [Pseudomonadota bacterium]